MKYSIHDQWLKLVIDSDGIQRCMKYKTLSQQFREVLRFLFVSEFISAIFYDFYN